VVQGFKLTCLGRDPLITVYSKMEIAKRKDILQRDCPHEVKPALFLILPNTNQTSSGI
jgi:hypothetical protein